LFDDDELLLLLDEFEFPLDDELVDGLETLDELPEFDDLDDGLLNSLLDLDDDDVTG